MSKGVNFFCRSDGVNSYKRAACCYDKKPKAPAIYTLAVFPSNKIFLSGQRDLSV
jgi:hypothetical protein